MRPAPSTATCSPISMRALRTPCKAIEMRLKKAAASSTDVAGHEKCFATRTLNQRSVMGGRGDAHPDVQIGNTFADLHNLTDVVVAGELRIDLSGVGQAQEERALGSWTDERGQRADAHFVWMERWKLALLQDSQARLCEDNLMASCGHALPPMIGNSMEYRICAAKEHTLHLETSSMFRVRAH